MLIVSLRDGEYITIGESVRIIILRTRGSDERLGIDAPPDISVRKATRDKLIVGEQQEGDKE